jgi:glutamine amidotransferase
MLVTIFDYGAGNIHSLAKALATANVDVVLETDAFQAIHTDLLVLPGVGAFGTATEQLRPARTAMRDAIRDGLPTLGVCLGMQLLFEASEEGGGAGLGVFSGRVTRLRASRSPQIGWNSVEPTIGLPIADGESRMVIRSVYYANGFVCRPIDESIVAAWSTHEDDRFPAVVRRGAVTGVQFHPEKSSREGVSFLRAIVEEARP